MPEYVPRRRRVGGLRIDAHKAASTRQPLAAAFIPERLFVPVEKHFGAAPQICVAPGDRVLTGQTLAAAQPGSGIADVHASSSGTVADVAELEIQTHHGAASLRCIVIATDGLDTPCAPLQLPEAAQRSDVIEFIRQCGIVGLGGAAVSTSWKLTRGESLPTLIINAAECEPYISCDDMLMREHAHGILEGSLAICRLAEANQCIVAIERDKPRALEAMRAAAAEIGDSRLHIAELPSIYPAGGERQLVELLVGREVPSGAYPADIGILCQNVATAFAVHEALTLGRPLLSRVVTLTGAGIREPRNVHARIGTTIADLVSHFGGYSDEAAALIIGGSMMGVAQADDSIPVRKSTNCILVAGAEEFGAKESEWPCIRCGECAGACPARLLPQELLRAADADNYPMLDTLGLDDCIECGCCDAICPSHIALTRRFVVARQALKQRRESESFAAGAQARFDAHTSRLAGLEHAREESQAELRAQVATEAERRRAIEQALQRVRSRRKDDGGQE